MSVVRLRRVYFNLPPLFFENACLLVLYKDANQYFAQFVQN
ncbi:hypothetical protein D1AOALGA4SA_9422 [Olavius algarvensis Delta 1 endosymbiont]|nr:hypothetical protein D1AOALGA4SA_9422 [Olavius algarvensis Delta 1 endosymbiont]